MNSLYGDDMLKITQVGNIDDFLDFVYKLSTNNETAKKSLLNSMRSDNKNLFVIYEKNNLVGVFGYYWIDEDKYIQTTIFTK